MIAGEGDGFIAIFIKLSLSYSCIKFIKYSCNNIIGHRGYICFRHHHFIYKWNRCFYNWLYQHWGGMSLKREWRGKSTFTRWLKAFLKISFKIFLIMEQLVRFLWFLSFTSSLFAASFQKFIVEENLIELLPLSILSPMNSFSVFVASSEMNLIQLHPEENFHRLPVSISFTCLSLQIQLIKHIWGYYI